MSHIHSKDTECEVLLRHELWHRGYRYFKNYKKLPGKPDICITKFHVAIFCDSDYFHGRNWDSKLKDNVSRGNNGQYWTMKIEENIKRDQKIDAQLRELDWIVLHFWSSEIIKDVNNCACAVDDIINGERAN